MKEFIDKLIERLEELYQPCYLCREDKCAIDRAISIVNQLAEEYKDKVMIDGQYCWQACSATEHCKECNRLCNGSIDYYENYDFMAEEYKGGWIPCSERLPETDDYVLCWYEYRIMQGTCEGEMKQTYGIGYYLKPFKNWGGEVSCGRDCKVIAWMPLPAPYTEGE